MRALRLLVIVSATVFASAAPAQEAAQTPLAAISVGIEGRVLVRAQSGEWAAALVEGDAPIALRLAGSSPDGQMWLHDVRFIGTIPGAYDLRSFLVGAEGEDPIWVLVQSVLPDSHGGDLFETAAPALPRLGGYRAALLLVVAVWLALPVTALVRWVRERLGAARPRAQHETLRVEDELQSVLAQLRAGAETAAVRARFELLLIGRWREALDLDGAPHAQAIARLREHPQAGAAIVELERWLHAPQGAEPDVEALVSGAPARRDTAEEGAAP